MAASQYMLAIHMINVEYTVRAGRDKPAKLGLRTEIDSPVGLLVSLA